MNYTNKRLFFSGITVTISVLLGSFIFLLEAITFYVEPELYVWLVFLVFISLMLLSGIDLGFIYACALGLAIIILFNGFPAKLLIDMITYFIILLLCYDLSKLFIPKKKEIRE